MPPWLFRRVDAFAAKDHAGTQPFIRLLELTIDPQKRRVERHGRELSLTAKHFDLLLFLASHPGHVYTRTQLLEHVWGYG
ncbi:MAG: winged helix-turn-helix domain-containing protein [Vicinamibacterales bacterium]